MGPARCQGAWRFTLDLDPKGSFSYVEKRGKSTLTTWNQRRGGLGVADTLCVVRSRRCWEERQDSGERRGSYTRATVRRVPGGLSRGAPSLWNASASFYLPRPESGVSLVTPLIFPAALPSRVWAHLSVSFFLHLHSNLCSEGSSACVHGSFVPCHPKTGFHLLFISSFSNTLNSLVLSFPYFHSPHNLNF